MFVSICFSKFNSLMHMHTHIMQYVGLIHSSPKENFCQIYMTYVKAVAVALIPVVSSNESSLHIVVGVPAKEHNIHI
jgi:hypothetical protein